MLKEAKKVPEMFVADRKIIVEFKKYFEDMAVDGNLIKKELGFLPKYDLKRGWVEAIEEMRSKNRIRYGNHFC